MKVQASARKLTRARCVRTDRQHFICHVTVKCNAYRSERHSGIITELMGLSISSNLTKQLYLTFHKFCIISTSSSNDETPSGDRKPWFAATFNPGLHENISLSRGLLSNNERCSPRSSIRSWRRRVEGVGVIALGWN